MSINKVLAFEHGSTCSDDLNIPDSTNISGNLDLAWKYLKLAPKSVCRIPTYVNFMKCNKSYARHRQIYKDAANSTVGDCVSCIPLIYYSCCNHWSAKKTEHCVSNTACIVQSYEVGKQRRTKIFVATPSHKVSFPQSNDLFLTWNHVLIKCS